MNGVDQWLELWNAEPDVWGLVDTRSRADFSEKHLQNSTNIPWDELRTRVHELPMRGAKLSFIVADAAQQSEVSTWALQTGYTAAFAEVDSPDLWSRATDKGAVETGATSMPLWRASPCLVDVIETVEANVHSEKPWSAIDLACGCGRDAVFLALRGWNVYGVDCMEDQIARVNSMSETWGVSDRLRAEVVDLEARGATDGFSADLVNVARYLHRPLFPLIKTMVKPGGVLVFHTFMDGCQHSAVGRPKKAQRLLRPGELAVCFGMDGWDILIDRVENIPDGRPTSYFVARKPLSVDEVLHLPSLGS